LNTPYFARDRKRKHQHFRAFFVSAVRAKQSHLFHRCLFAAGMPRAACPVTCEAYLTRVRGEHHYQYMKQQKKSIFFFGAFYTEV
jgi:hypothetical protein